MSKQPTKKVLAQQQRNHEKVVEQILDGGFSGYDDIPGGPIPKLREELLKIGDLNLGRLQRVIANKINDAYHNGFAEAKKQYDKAPFNRPQAAETRHYKAE